MSTYVYIFPKQKKIDFSFQHRMEVKPALDFTKLFNNFQQPSTSYNEHDS